MKNKSSYEWLLISTFRRMQTIIRITFDFWLDMNKQSERWQLVAVLWCLGATTVQFEFGILLLGYALGPSRATHRKVEMIF